MEAADYSRHDTHCQMLVDVGIVLARAHGAEYARAFLNEMQIPQDVISRVLSGNVRRMLHLAPLSPAHGEEATLLNT